MRRWYRDRYRTEIESGRMPDSFRQHLVDSLYRHRFGSFLLIPGGLLFVFLLWVSPWVLETIGIDRTSLSAGTVIVAVLSLPILTFVWFIRSYERDRELARGEDNLWSGEFNRFISAAASSENEILRRAAIRQLQDYLSGAKWLTNQRSNSTAIFELFSSIVDERWGKLERELGSIDEKLSEKRDETIEKYRQDPVLITIGAVLRAVCRKHATGRPSPIRVSQNSLANLHFDLLDISSVDVSELDMMSCTFRHTVLYDAKLSGASLRWTILLEAYLSEADLRGAYLYNANLSQADLTEADLSGAQLQSANLSGADLSKANLTKADFSGADLSRARMLEARLPGADLSRTILSEADASGADFSKAHLSGATMLKARLSAADFSKADMSRANLSMADLSKAILSKADLSGANLTGASLSQTDLSGARLSAVDLPQTDLSGAKLVGTG